MIISNRRIRQAGKKVCNSLFPRQMELRRIRLQKEARKERERWFNGLREEDYPKEVAKMYLKATGHELHLDDPKRYTEKIQWRKLYDRNPIYSRLTDKYKGDFNEETGEAREKLNDAEQSFVDFARDCRYIEITKKSSDNCKT